MTWDLTIPPTDPADQRPQVERLAHALYAHPVPQPLADGTIAQASSLLQTLTGEQEATISLLGDAVQGIIDWWTFKFAVQRKADAPPLPHGVEPLVVEEPPPEPAP